jgi:hypothetical protein
MEKLVGATDDMHLGLLTPMTHTSESRGRAKSSFAALVAGLVAVALSGIGIGTAQASYSCPDGSNATAIQASGISCSSAQTAIGIYEGAPTGCVEANGCSQSGSIRHKVALVSCSRTQFNVSCAVFIKTRKRRGGKLRNKRSSVTFTMLHDPYGCPGSGLPNCYPQQ